MFMLDQECPYILVIDIQSHPQGTKNHLMEHHGVFIRADRDVVVLYLILSYTLKKKALPEIIITVPLFM